MTDEPDGYWDDPGWDETDWDDDVPAEWDERWEQEYARRRVRRQRRFRRVALVMLGSLLLPIVLQTWFVASTLAARLGLMVVVLPGVVAAIVLSGRRS